MSESTIRRFVRAAMEEQSAEVALFSDERIRSFFAVVKTLVHDCFYSLYDTVMQQYVSAAEKQQRLSRGLAYIASDSNHTLGDDEVMRALEEFPTVQEEYERAIVRFAQFMLPERQPGMKVEVPPFATFLMKVYRRVATSPDVKSGRFFSMTYFEKDILLKDMFRVTMNSCVSLRPAAVSVISADSKSTRTQSRLLSGALQHAASAASPSAAGSTSGSASATGTASSASRASKVMPSDSVSNIYRKPPPVPRKTPQQYSAVEEGSEEEQGTSSTVSDVTQFSLRKYKKQLEEKKRAPKPFVTPSIARGAARTEEKQVNIESKSVSGFFDDDEQGDGAASDFAGFSTLSRH